MAANWVRKGCPPSKLVIGIASYGRTFTLANQTDWRLGDPDIGQGGKAGPYTRENGIMSYYEVSGDDY